MVSEPDPTVRLEALTDLLESHRDILEGRVTEPVAPEWSEARRWTSFLLGLDDSTVEGCEREGPAVPLARHPAVPPSLRELAERSLVLSALPSSTPPSTVAPLPRRAGPKKRDQIESLAALAPPGALRVIDFGSGHGHFTRRIARALGLPALGLERSAASVATARALEPDPLVRFEQREVTAVADIGADDLLVGLHACGGLGDTLIDSARRGGSRVLLVSCCPQKVLADPRAPLSSRGLTLNKDLLGLANLAALGGGVEAADAVERRRIRLGLRLLLLDAGFELAPGEEARGLNRRRFRHPLHDVAPAAFALRGASPPSPSAIRASDARAREEHAVIRRLALPRTLLARPLEVAIGVDRATALIEAGGQARVFEAFPRHASPRNIAVVGRGHL